MPIPNDLVRAFEHAVDFHLTLWAPDVEEPTVAAPDSKQLPLPTGQRLAYFYFEREAGRRSAAKLLTRGEAFLLA